MAKIVALSGGDDALFCAGTDLGVYFTGTSITLYGWELLEECQISKNERLWTATALTRLPTIYIYIYNCWSGFCFHTPTQVSET